MFIRGQFLSLSSFLKKGVAIGNNFDNSNKDMHPKPKSCSFSYILRGSVIQLTFLNRKESERSLVG